MPDSPTPPALSPAEREEIRRGIAATAEIGMQEGYSKRFSHNVAELIAAIPRLLDALDAADAENIRLQAAVTELRGVLWTIDRAPQHAAKLAPQGMRIADAVLSPPQR